MSAEPQSLLDPVAISRLFVPRQGIYLLNHSVGPMPLSASSVLEQKFFAPWESGSPDPWPQWITAIEGFNQALAKLFNSDAKAFCPQVNVSSAAAKILQSLPPKAGKDVLLFTENDFPSLGFVLQQAKKLGYRLKMLPRTADPQDAGTWESALTSDVHSVLITHVHFNTSKLVPVKDIIQLSTQRDIISMVDIAQSAGIVPIDFKDWQADIVMGSCVKWLCGGPGAGFLWVDPSFIHQLTPIDVGWFSHKDPFEFDITHFEYADTTARFWGGTPSVLPYALAANSLDLICHIGIEKIAAHNRRLTQKMIDQLPQTCLQSPSQDERRGGTVVLKFDCQEKIEKALHSAGVLFDSRDQGLRLSPHITNTEEEIDTVISCLKNH